MFLGKESSNKTKLVINNILVMCPSLLDVFFFPFSLSDSESVDLYLVTIVCFSFSWRASEGEVVPSSSIAVLPPLKPFFLLLRED